MHPTTPNRARTAAARRAHMFKAADRAVDDPAKLAKAARIVKRAIQRGALDPSDVLADRNGAAA